MKPTKKPAQPIQLTPALLKSIIEEEVKGFGDMEDVEKRAKDTDELDADEQADGVEEPVDWKKANHIKESDTLDGHVDYMKALKIEESRLTHRLAKVRANLQRGAKKLVAAKIV
jgi:hypothetical protein